MTRAPPRRTDVPRGLRSCRYWHWSPPSFRIGLCVVALDFLREGPFMYLGRTIVDSEGADFAKHLFDNGVSGHARAAHHLDASVGDPHQPFRYRYLSHRTLNGAERTRVQHVSAPVDHQFGLFQLDQIFGKHESNALVIDKRLAEAVTATGITSCNFVSAGGASV